MHPTHRPCSPSFIVIHFLNPHLTLWGGGCPHLILLGSGYLQRNKIFNKLPRSQPASGRAEPRTQASSLYMAGSPLLFSQSLPCRPMEQSFFKETFILVLYGVFIYYCSCQRIIMMMALEGPMEMWSQQENLGSSLICWLILKSPHFPAGLEWEGGACGACSVAWVEGWGILCRNMGVRSPRSTLTGVAKALCRRTWTLDSPAVPRRPRDCSWSLEGGQKRRSGTLPAGAWLPESAGQHYSLGQTGRSHFLFVNSGHAPLASFLPAALPELRFLWPGEGTWPRVLWQEWAGQPSPCLWGRFSRPEGIPQKRRLESDLNSWVRHNPS